MTYQSSSAWTTTTTGRASMKMTLYRECTLWPLTSAPCFAHPVRTNRIATANSHPRRTRFSRPCRDRISLWSDGERVDHADRRVRGPVVLSLWSALLPAREEIVPRRQIEDL